MSFAARFLMITAGATLLACGGRPAAVSPDEIPDLESRLEAEPQNGDLVLRYAAALFAAGRCDTAMTTARTGMGLMPAKAVGPLVLGQCQEQTNPTQAVETYRAFLAAYPGARGAPAVRAREQLAARAQATQFAQAAIADDANRTAAGADLQAVAVLPLQVTGDTIYRPLSRGLAQILISDLALLQRFRMVERLQLGALLDEIDFQQGARVEQSTAVRVGRLMRAGRLVSGLVAIPDEDNLRLEASVVLATGEVTAPASVDGRLRDLLRIEKDLVVDIAVQLGYTLSEAERQAVLENGTQNLAAFLAYSRGLEAEDLGDYAGAAVYYGQAVQRDPGFQAAREGYQSSSTTDEVQGASANEVTTVAAVEAPPEPIDPLEAAVGATLTDLVPTLVEQNTLQQTGQGGTSTQGGGDDPPPPPPPPPPIGIIRIVFRLP